jgi:hypothetical protein
MKTATVITNFYDDQEAGGRCEIRLLTTLLDHHVHPARDLAYAERRQAEITYLRIKKTLRGAGKDVRGHSAELDRQEIWVLLIVYDALCGPATQVAALESIDPDEISFVAVLRLTRAHLQADSACRHCGHRPSDLGNPLTALTGDIAVHPATAPAEAAPARAPPRNATPDIPARPYTRSSSPNRIHPKQPGRLPVRAVEVSAVVLVGCATPHQRRAEQKHPDATDTGVSNEVAPARPSAPPVARAQQRCTGRRVHTKSSTRSREATAVLASVSRPWGLSGGCAAEWPGAVCRPRHRRPWSWCTPRC